MTKKIKPSILPGFMELPPKEQLIFNDIVSKMSKVYEQNGCMPMDTPLIEKEEILLAKSAGETEKQVYRIDKEKNKQALRFDLTVPFARYVVQHMNELDFPFKRYQFGKVYRGERNQKGRYREFYQLDIDIVSPRKLDITNDAFVISLAAQAFESIGLKDYRFQISNRKILSGLLEMLGIAEQQEVMGIIDKYDKIGKENCIKGIEELEEVINTVRLLGVNEQNLRVELKIIRGLDYYTGTVFETVIERNENYGSICSGGRYDNLAELYTDMKIPGVGISIGITRLFFVLKEIGFVGSYTLEDTLDYLISPIGNTLKECIEVNQALQKQDIKSEIYLNKDPLKKQLSYADAKEISTVIIIGEDEVEKGQLIIKNMKTGEQTKVSRKEWLKREF
ncbi:HisS family protein [Zhenhengia yiwuensis]|uniref:histidine--tRNA ligase n=1 Tax=Zhenhengia yiwuensis TaxID=2763666 RepID=UPI002A74F02B|nr:HisS family protein [Zhenhengia yiwuensis]MDY3368721.1 HisS family protein [Zhenhengia yiwuensis]